MATKIEVTCDVCGRQKQAVNCWWKYRPSGATFLVSTSEAVPGSMQEYVLDACSQSCVIKALSQYLATAYDAPKEIRP